VYDSLYYLCELKNVVHDIPLTPAIACLTVALFSFPEKYIPPPSGAVRGVNESMFSQAKHYSTTTAASDGDELRSTE
jgi:hypothetical protein